MTIVKSLAIVALLVGGTSLAMAQNGPPGPGVNPAPNYGQSAAPPTSASGARITHRTTHHKKMYMSAKARHHKTLQTGQQLPKQSAPKQ